jgi:DNA-binding response OmpR family regulator
MPVVLVCTPSPQDLRLVPTILQRDGVERHHVGKLEDALTMAVASRPDLVLIDRELPRAGDLVSALRREPITRGCSVAVLAPGDFEPSEIELLEAGANAILRLPAGPEWDERLIRLLSVPMRCEARFPVQFAVQATHVDGEVVGIALNLSAHGMLMQSPVPLSVTEVLTFVLELPEFAVPGKGRIVRQAANSQYGISFETMDSSSHDEILKYVSTRG